VQLRTSRAWGQTTEEIDVTSPLIDRNADDEFAEIVGDAALVGLLRGKPLDDEVPAAVWWLIAETLRTTVELRQAVTGQDTESVNVLTGEAVLLTEAALAELAASTGAHPTPVDLTGDLPRVPTRPAFGIQLSVLVLARMLVSHTPTAPLRVANTLAAHLRAIAAVPVG
jgi:hypothetical protein